MKKITTMLLALTLIASPISIFAEADSNNSVENTQNIRNQNIYVLTKDGVQRATFEEAQKIANLESYPLTNLTKSYLLGDYKSGKILESYNIDEVRPMASTSKLVGIFVVMDKISDGSLKKTDRVLIDHEASSLTGSTYKLKENDTKTVDELLTAAIVISGNDAITALGKHISGSVEAFVSLMNKKCQDLGLKNAHMVNPTGLTNYAIEDYNKMTTREMFILARELIKKHPDILEYTTIDKIEEVDRNFKEFSTNPLLGIVHGIDGLKTGYTNAAGRCLIATGKTDGIEGQTLDTRLIGITTGSNNDMERFVAAKKLMEDGLKKYKYTIIGNPDESVSEYEFEESSKPAKIYERDSKAVLWDSKSEITRKIEIDKNLKAPIGAGEVVGTITYLINGTEILKNELIVKERVTQKGLIYKIKSICEDIFLNLNKAA